MTQFATAAESAFASKDWLAVVRALRSAYDTVDEDALRRAVAASSLAGISEAANWMGVAWTPEEHESMYNLGVLLWARDDRLDDAIDVTRIAMEMGDADSANALPDMLMWAHAADAAPEAFSILNSHGIEGDASIWLRIGNALYARGEPRDGEEAYRRSIALGDGNAAHNLANHLVAHGRIEEAQKLLDLAVARGDDDAAEARAELDRS